MKQLSYFLLTAVMAVFLCVNAWAQSNTSSTVASTVTVDKAPAMASSGPNIMVNQSDSCMVSYGAGGISTSLFGLAAGGVKIDEACSVRKSVKLLFSLGLKVASVSLLCHSNRDVFMAMYRAGSYCPANTGEKAVIGIAAKEYWDNHPEEIPGYVKPVEEISDEELTGIGIGGLLFLLLLL